nr:bacteriorhodopsin [uncultured Halomonas sp.]
MSASVQITFVIGSIIMLAAGIVFWMMTRSTPKDQHHHGVAAMTIVFVAFANYFAMALGQGHVQFDGRDVFFARYTDWLITTPILLASLAMMASDSIAKIRTLVFALVAADVYMILTGLVGDFSNAPYNYYWWIISMVAFLAVLYMIWVPLQAKAHDGIHGSTFKTMATILTVLWICYPIVWLIGSSGFSIISLTLESWLYLILDVCAKVGFGFVALSAVRKGTQHSSNQYSGARQYG